MKIFLNASTSNEAIKRNLLASSSNNLNITWGMSRNFYVNLKSLR